MHLSFKEASRQPPWYTKHRCSFPRYLGQVLNKREDKKESQLEGIIKNSDFEQENACPGFYLSLFL